MLTPKRIYVQEMLDAGCGTDRDVAQNLEDLRRINRSLRGTGTVLKALSESLDGKKVTRLSLLDIGTGSADIPNAVVKWCSSRGIEPSVVALDISARNLRVARNDLGIKPEVALVQADAMQPPFPDGSFDYVTASLFLHHFQEDEIVDLLRSFARIARRAIVINDLVRNLVPYYFIRLMGPILMSSYLTRNDGPVSVLRGFTAGELRDLAGRAGIRNYRVERLFPYRLLMVAE
jgi:2-polyprenyl-3-methyl-5-hydroxy-6-metoxy-1,4-benzoquinol methylase